MSLDQINRLLGSLEKIAAKEPLYTITGAADWEILVVMGFMMVAMIGVMWADLRGGQRTNKEDFKKDIDNVWQGMRDCKTDCCHRDIKPTAEV